MDAPCPSGSVSAAFLLHRGHSPPQREDGRGPLAFHSFTLSYTSPYSLIHVLWGVYRRQVSTIGGATLHMVSMSHQKYVAWATMCMYCMRGHERWLRASLTSVEDLYKVSFRRVACDTRAMWHNVLLSLTRALWEEAACLFFRVLQCAHSSSSGPAVGPMDHPHKTLGGGGPA